MPIDPAILANFAGTDFLNAAAYTDRWGAIEDWLNGGILGVDLKQTAWAKSDHLVAPRFFGSPDQHMLAISGDVWWRRSADFFLAFDDFAPDAWVPIPHAAVNVLCSPPPQVSTGHLEITCDFFSYEGLGDIQNNAANEEADANEAGRYQILIDGVPVDGTARRIFPSLLLTSQYLRKNHSIAVSIGGLTPGPHTVCLAVRPNPATDTSSPGTPGSPDGNHRDWRFIWTGNRSFSAEVNYL
jgi:hypothetical protein